MTLNFKNTLSFLVLIVLINISASTFACSCIGKNKQTTESELNLVDLAVKGKVIAVKNFDYYDTAAYSLSGRKFDTEQSSYLIHKYRVFTLLIDNKYKAAKNMADTIQVVTGYGGGDCGYEFEVGKEYIVYGEAWKEKVISVRNKKRKDKRRITEIVMANMYYTHICRLTQVANTRELENLKRLTQ